MARHIHTCSQQKSLLRRTGLKRKGLWLFKFPNIYLINVNHLSARNDKILFELVSGYKKY